MADRVAAPSADHVRTWAATPSPHDDTFSSKERVLSTVGKKGRLPAILRFSRDSMCAELGLLLGWLSIGLGLRVESPTIPLRAAALIAIATPGLMPETYSTSIGTVDSCIISTVVIPVSTSFSMSVSTSASPTLAVIKRRRRAGCDEPPKSKAGLTVSSSSLPCWRIGDGADVAMIQLI